MQGLLSQDLISNSSLFGNLSGSTIKNIQRGTYNYYNQTSANITIANVDLSKAIVLVSYNNTGQNTTDSYNFIAAKLTSSTNLNLSSYSSTGVYSFYVHWIVIEFNNIKSLQKGSYVWVSSSGSYGNTQTISISQVNMNKSIVVYSMKSNSFSGSLYVYPCIADLQDSKTIYFERFDGIATIEWQVIEFN